MDTVENEILATFQFNAGYFNTDEMSYPPGAAAGESKNIFLLDNNAQRPFRGLTGNGTGGRTMFNVAGGYASLNDVGGTQGRGSVFNFINESLFAIGAGEVFYNGSVLVDATPSPANVTATSTLQLAPKVGSYTYPEWYTAGFSQPNAPQVRARDVVSPYTGKNKGVYSFKIAAVRSTTGARSIASVTSAAITLTDQTVHITLPAAASNGQDRWAIFGTKAGFGGVGVHYLVTEIGESDLSTIDSIARSYVFEYSDSDLLPIVAYTDDYPPQAALFATRLENYVLTFGAYNNAVQCSIRNFPESFNPEHLGFLPKPPTAVLQDPQGSYVYVSTESSVHIVNVIPSTDNPLVIQTLWADVGVANSHNWCAINGVLFAFTGKAGAVTMGANGTPTPQFAMPVSKAMRDWDVNSVVVHHIPHLNSVAYSFGTESYLFNLQTLKWSPPAKSNDFFSGNITSAVVVDRKAYITLKVGSTFSLYEFDTGATSMTFLLVSAMQQPNPGGRVNILGMKAVYASPITGASPVATIRTDYSGSTAATLSHTNTVGVNTTKRARWYLPRRNALAISWGGTIDNFVFDCYFGGAIVYGTIEESSVL